MFRRGQDKRSWNKLQAKAEYLYSYAQLYGSESDHPRGRLDRAGPFEVTQMSRHQGQGPVVHRVAKYHMDHGNSDWWMTPCGLRPLDEPVIWWAPTWAQVDCIGCLVGE